MKLLAAVLFGLFIVLGVSCTNKDNSTSSTMPGVNTQGTTAETTSAIHENRAEYLSAMETKLGDWRSKIGNLKASRDKYAASSPNYKAMDGTIAQMETQLNEARSELDQLKQSGADAWQSHRPKIDSRLSGLDKSFEKIQAE